MDAERLQHQGRLAVERQEAYELQVKLEGLRDELRRLLDPFAALAELKGEQIVRAAVELGNAQVEYTTKLELIRRIEKALGR